MMILVKIKGDIKDKCGNSNKYGGAGAPNFNFEMPISVFLVPLHNAVSSKHHRIYKYIFSSIHQSLNLFSSVLNLLSTCPAGCSDLKQKT